MGVVSIVLGLLIAAFVAIIVIAQIRTEARTRQRQQKERDHQDRRAEPSHEKAKTREWWV
jgi:large-conductance mechanosensitive channel